MGRAEKLEYEVEDARMSSMPERIRELEVKVETALEGVANFREFQRDARDFFSRHDSREEEQEKTESHRHQQNQTKINIILAITAIATLIIMAVGVYVSYEVSRHSMLNPADLFRSCQVEPVLSYAQPQVSGLPNTR